LIAGIERADMQTDRPYSLLDRLRRARHVTNVRRRRVVDLTHPLRAGFPVFPAFREPTHVQTMTIEHDGYLSHELTLGEHTGTHVDAPAHFVHDGATADALPCAALVAPLAVIRITERAARDPDSELEPGDVAHWERAHGRIAPGALVALDSGWAPRARDTQSFLSTDDAHVMHFPGVSADAAELLVGTRDIAGIAVDSISLDHGPSLDTPAHRVLLGAGRFGVECVAGLERVPEHGAIAVIGAIPILGGSGAPARVLALI
jgi:kynurenine formamidase